MGVKKTKLTNYAFTLAEVLITLGIIGIVAEITIPSLYNSFMEQNYKVAYKKAFSVANQALEKANADYLLVPASAEGDTASHQANFLAWMSEFKVSKKCISGSDNAECWGPGEKYGASAPYSYSYAFVDASGMAWSMYYPGLFDVFVDTNGFKKPNQYGKDRFFLGVTNTRNQSGESGTPMKFNPFPDNPGWGVCDQTNKCYSQNNYFGTSWLYN